MPNGNSVKVYVFCGIALSLLILANTVVYAIRGSDDPLLTEVIRTLIATFVTSGVLVTVLMNRKSDK